MASVNLTCTACSADVPCERCRSITRALRAAGHSVTHSSRYEALRAAALGTYGFDACVLVVERHEPAIVDAAHVLLGRARVGLVVESAALGQRAIPDNFSVIDARELQRQPFPTQWVETVPARLPELEETQALAAPEAMPPDIESARRRLKTVARRVQRELGATGFSGEPRLDLMAALEDELAWAKMSGTSFGLVLVHVPRKGEADEVPDLEQLLTHVHENLERVIRASDAIARGSDSLMVVVAEATAEETLVVSGRIKKTMRKAQKDARREHPALGRITLGVAVYPTHGTTRAALLARATASATAI